MSYLAINIFDTLDHRTRNFTTLDRLTRGALESACRPESKLKKVFKVICYQDDGHGGDVTTVGDVTKMENLPSQSRRTAWGSRSDGKALKLVYSVKRKISRFEMKLCSPVTPH